MTEGLKIPQSPRSRSQPPLQGGLGGCRRFVQKDRRGRRSLQFHTAERYIAFNTPLRHASRATSPQGARQGSVGARLVQILRGVRTIFLGPLTEGAVERMRDWGSLTFNTPSVGYADTSLTREARGWVRGNERFLLLSPHQSRIRSTASPRGEAFFPPRQREESFNTPLRRGYTAPPLPKGRGKVPLPRRRWRD